MKAQEAKKLNHRGVALLRDESSKEFWFHRIADDGFKEKRICQVIVWSDPGKSKKDLRIILDGNATYDQCADVMAHLLAGLLEHNKFLADTLTKGTGQ